MSEIEPFEKFSVELIILEGLDAAIHKSWMTQDERSEWLNSYIDKHYVESKILVDTTIKNID